MSDLKNQGYDQEELYFSKLNKDLIEKRRQELDSKKSSQHADLICPKCQKKMDEINMSGILVDRCTGCKGIYFDSGELETLIQSKEPKSFLGALRKLF
jgi:ribosomal protein L37AE/L43A